MTRVHLAAALLIALPVAGAAQYAPAPPDRAADRRELRQDRRELADDRRDLAWFDLLVSRFDAARAGRNRRALAVVENDAAWALDRELHEARREVARSRQEVRRDGCDDRDRRDDRRDLRDDRRDARRIAALRAEFHDLRGQMSRRALDRKRAVIVELQRLARLELREDRRELREDRREARADWRQ